MKCPSSNLACECRRCRDARRAAAWQCAGVMFLIWCFGFVAACAVIGHCFFPVPCAKLCEPQGGKDAQ